MSNSIKLIPNKERELSNLLLSFRIEHEEVSLNEMEFFDVYDIKVSPGIRFNRIDNILPDLGMHLCANSTPRGYAVMSRGVYRIEVQKAPLPTMKFEELFSDHEDYYTPITLGVNSRGEPFYLDLNKLPNLLIGGVPGSGKSVLLHSIVLSLIKGVKPLLYLVDPKMVEFNIYKDSAKKIANSVEETYQIIEEVTSIMNSRFNKLGKTCSRDIHEYNSKYKNKMKPVVMIIDEWADIILQDKKIQKPLCILAQKGRAAGISIILATQRPSSKVISGLIKANFSGRIALKVASALDSRIILDCSGAEKVRGIGEGLYIDQSLSEPRVFKSTFLESPQDYIKVKSNKAKLPFWKRIWL